MKFKEAFEKFKQGIATPEEEDYVLSILEQGEEMCVILEETVETEEKVTENDDLIKPSKIKDKIVNVKNGALNAVGTALVNAGSKIKPAENNEVKHIKKLVFKKNVVTAFVVSLIVLIVVLGSLTATVFGIAANSAYKNTIEKTEVENTAILYIKESGLLSDGEIPIIADFKDELELEWPLEKSYMEYEVTFMLKTGQRVIVIVNGTTGTCSLRISLNNDDDD